MPSYLHDHKPQCPLTPILAYLGPMPASSSSSCRAMYPSSFLLNPWSWLTVTPIARPPDFTTAWQRKVGAQKRPRSLRGSPPRQSTASHRLSHLHLHGESRTSRSAGGSIGGWGRSAIRGWWEHRGWTRPSTGLQGACTVSMGWRGLKSLGRQAMQKVSKARSTIHASQVGAPGK